VFFVCLHGSAKSLIAAQHFNRLARDRRLELRAESVGVEPDASVPEPVIAGLARDGFDVRSYVPRAVQPDSLISAVYVVSFGCDVPIADETPSAQWNDMPLVSDGFDQARDAIVARVEQLVDELTRAALDKTKSPMSP
jgi:protein-tyrosine-phosphatase